MIIFGETITYLGTIFARMATTEILLDILGNPWWFRCFYADSITRWHTT